MRNKVLLFTYSEHVMLRWSHLWPSIHNTTQQSTSLIDSMNLILFLLNGSMCKFNSWIRCMIKRSAILINLKVHCSQLDSKGFINSDHASDFVQRTRTFQELRRVSRNIKMRNQTCLILFWMDSCAIKMGVLLKTTKRGEKKSSIGFYYRLSYTQQLRKVKASN